MRSLWSEPLHTANLAVLAITVMLAAAYVWSAFSYPISKGGLAAAAGAIVIAGTALLYSWRARP